MPEAPALGLDPAEFALDGVVPKAAFAPSDPEELSALLRDCDARGRTVVFFGGGTLQTLGHAPATYDVAVSLRRFARVIEYEHRDLTIAVEAGLPLTTLAATLAERGQFVPLDAPQAAFATVGGTLASGWLGPRRATYGRPRDFVIGTTVVLADGTVAKTGGMTVKNSTGYDLSKLYVGSLGTLAAIVRANFKTLPLPQSRRIAIATLPEWTRARALERVSALTIEPTAALLVKGFAKDIDGTDGADGRLLLLFEGSTQSVDLATRELRSALGIAGVPETLLIDRAVDAAFARTLDAYVATLGWRSATYRVAGLPSETGKRAEAFTELAAQNDIMLETIEDVRTGDTIARLSAATSATFAERLIDFDAQRRTLLPHARVLCAPQTVHAQLEVWGAPPPSLATMRALKTRFDPNGTLAPGRQAGRI